MLGQEPSRRIRGSLAVLAAVACWLLAAPGASAAVTLIGSSGVAPGTFNAPGADAVDSSGNLWVLDPERPSLQQFSNTGTYMTGTTSAAYLPSGGISGGLAIDSSNRLFIADATGITAVGESLTSPQTFGAGPAYVAVATGTTMVYALSVSAGQYELSEFNDTPPFSQVGATHVFPPGQLAAPNSNTAIHDQLAVDPSGDIYITDNDNQRVVELNGALMPIEAFTGFTYFPQTIAIAATGGATQVYVGDDDINGPDYVRRFSTAGTLLGSLTVGGAHGGLAVDASGNVFDSQGFGGSGNVGVLRIDTTPDPAIVATPTSGLTSQTVTFNGSTSETDMWGVADYSWDLDNSGAFATDTATVPTAAEQFNSPGTYPIALKVTGTNGRVGESTISYTVGDSMASFTDVGHALTGTPVTFDATQSVIPYSTVSDYAWDFDGSGSYGTDGGTTPTISHTFTTPGTYTVQLRVTRAGGRIDTAGGTFIVTPHPPSGTVGVSINGGDYATDSPHVQVDLVWPATASQLMISNDGGFGAPGGTQTLALADAVPWTLEQTGPDRLPKTVYVRFLGAGIDTQNFTDDIILDDTAPTLQSAQLQGGAASASAARAKREARPGRLYRIKVVAQDRIVGVCAVDASAHRGGGSVVAVRSCKHRGVRKLDRTVRFRLAAAPRYVRVRNSAGDWSHWLAVAG